SGGIAVVAKLLHAQENTDADGYDGRGPSEDRPVSPGKTWRARGRCRGLLMSNGLTFVDNHGALFQRLSHQPDVLALTIGELMGGIFLQPGLQRGFIVLTQGSAQHSGIPVGSFGL